MGAHDLIYTLGTLNREYIVNLLVIFAGEL